MPRVEDAERERAMRFVFVVLNTPLMQMSPDYQTALQLIETHKLDLAGLLGYVKKRNLGK